MQCRKVLHAMRRQGRPDAFCSSWTSFTSPLLLGQAEKAVHIFFYQALLLAKAESGGDLRQNDHVKALYFL